MKKFTTFETQLGESVVLTDKAKLSLYKKSQNSGYSVDILEEVYRRGYHCWTESFGGNPDSFAFDRVNSFIAGGFAEMLDEDLKKACWKGYEAIGMKMKNGKKVPNCVPVKEEDAEKHSTNPDDPASRFIGSDELVAVYKSQTPGQIIKRVVKEHLDEVAMYMPPDIQPPSITRPAPQRQFSRSVTTSGRMGSGAGAQSARVQVQRAAPARSISSRMSGQGGSMTGQVQTQRASAPRAPTSSMPSTQGGSMSAKPTVTKGVEATKYTVQKGMSSAGKEAATKAVEKAVPAAVGRAAGGALRTALGPAGMAAAAVMEPTPAGEKMSEFQRQDVMKKYNPFKSQGRSIADYEKQQVTRKTASAPTADEAPKPKVTADVPTPPSRPEYMSRGQAFSAAREKAGGGEGQFKYDDKSYQTNIKSEPYIPAAKQKSTGIESESGGKTLKKIKEAISEAKSKDQGYQNWPGEKKKKFFSGPKDKDGKTETQKWAERRQKEREEKKGQVDEATYKGKKVPLNKPMAGDVKKSKVFVDPDGDGKAQKVNFGDKNMSIKKDQPARKKSYCARSGGQGNLNDKTSANYWSRRAWNCEETQVDEVWSTAPQRRSFTLGKRDAEATPEQRAKIKDVIKNMKVPGPAGETPEAREARMARNKARQMAAVGMSEEQVNELSVPAGTTGKRTSISTPMVAVRMASGKVEKHPPGKSGSSGGGDE